jgi:predicted metalloendopeptidase
MLKRIFPALAVALGVLAARGAVETQYFDPAVRPQDDFYRHVNGRWLDSTEIPPDLARYASFTRLQQDNWTRLHALCDEAAKGKGASAAERWVGDFYASGLDEAAIEAAVTKPLDPELARIAAIRNPADIARALAHLRMLGVNVGFSFEASADDRNSTMEIATLAQSGLGLAISDEPRDADRDYYLSSRPDRQKLREGYVALIGRMFELLGDNPEDAQRRAGRVLALETELATVSSDRVKLRDPQANYHRIGLDELRAATPGFDWDAFLTETGAPAFTQVNVTQPNFVSGLAQAVARFPVEDWKQYLRWHLIRSAAPYMADRFAAEHFRFFGAEMSGVAQREPRWKRVVVAIDANIGDALGQLYAAHFFPPEAKARVLQLVANVRAALRERLQTLEWMDEPTRASAVRKLDAFTVNMGYPERWKNYSSVRIGRATYLENIFHAREFESRRNWAKIGQPVDRKEWSMTVPTVNAYYSSSINGITFPAGILQPPFFDAKADDAVNYGGIGVVIGHEMTHGFDDSGRQYDADGNLNDWWTPESAARFKERAAKIVRQFSSYVAIDDVHLNGELTQGENIADLGGLRVAYAALQKSLAGKPAAKIDGFTPEQRFFISHATVWRDKMRPAEAIRRAAVDPHSPGKWRVNGPLSNLDEFAKAFQVPEGAPMRRSAEDRVIIW